MCLFKILSDIIEGELNDKHNLIYYKLLYK